MRDVLVLVIHPVKNDVSRWKEVSVVQWWHWIFLQAVWELAALCMLRSRLPDGCLSRLLKLTYFLNVCPDLDLLTEVFMHSWSDWLNRWADQVTTGSRENKAPNQNVTGWGSVCVCVPGSWPPPLNFKKPWLLKKKFWRERNSVTTSTHFSLLLLGG